MQIKGRSIARFSISRRRRIRQGANRKQAHLQVCGVDQMTDRSPNLPDIVPSLNAATSAASGEKACALEAQNLLRLSQQLYAHALTLQELIRNGGSTTYENLRPRYDRQAAQQFEVFSRSFTGL